MRRPSTADPASPRTRRAPSASRRARPTAALGRPGRLRGRRAACTPTPGAACPTCRATPRTARPQLPGRRPADRRRRASPSTPPTRPTGAGRGGKRRPRPARPASPWCGSRRSRPPARQGSSGSGPPGSRGPRNAPARGRCSSSARARSTSAPAGLPNSAVPRLACSSASISGSRLPRLRSSGEGLDREAQAGGQELGAGAQCFESGVRRRRPGAACVRQLGDRGGHRPRVQMRDRRGEREPRIRGARVGAHGGQRPAQRPQIPAEEQRHARAVHQLGDQAAVAGPLGVAQGVHRLRPARTTTGPRRPAAAGRSPGGSARDRRPGRSGAAGGCGTSPGEVRSTSAVSCRRSSSSRSASARSDSSAASAAGTGEHTLTTPQEVLRLRAQAVEDLAGQVLGDRALVARELGEEGDGVVGAAQRERGEPQSGCPAVGASMQHRHLRRGQRAGRSPPAGRRCRRR